MKDEKAIKHILGKMQNSDVNQLENISINSHKNFLIFVRFTRSPLWSLFQHNFIPVVCRCHSYSASLLLFFFFHLSHRKFLPLNKTWLMFILLLSYQDRGRCLHHMYDAVLNEYDDK